MTIQHLRGSLAQNILDITKGGGCPKIKPWNKRYSVLRYFSRMKDKDCAGVTGPIGDGGFYITDYYQRDYLYPYQSYGSIYCNTANLNFNTKLLTFPLSDGTGDFLQIENNYLGICNQRELITPTGGTDTYFATGSGVWWNPYWLNDSSSNSIQNIEVENDVIEKDVDGYYNYYLLKNNHTMDITPAGTSTPVSKTAELMEFVYLHAFIAKCRTGELYIEIEDFEIVGTITNDYLIYVYYWETPKDKSNINSATVLESEIIFFDTTYLRGTDQGNICCKCFRFSDLQGNGTDNKLIIWLNRNKTRQEGFAVNVLIGLKPQDHRKDSKFHDVPSTGLGEDYTWWAPSYDSCSDIIFKFKKATIKNRKYPTTIDNRPLPFPSWGFKDLDANLASTYYFTHQSRGSTLGAIANWYDEGDAGASNQVRLYCHVRNGFLYGYNLINFYKDVGDGAGLNHNVFDPLQNYVLKLPNLTDVMSIKIQPDGGGGWEYIASDTDWKIKIYCGETVINTGDPEADYATFLNTLVLLHTYNISDLCGALLTSPNDGQDWDYLGIGVADVTYPAQSRIFAKKNKYKYLEFAGSDLPDILEKYFYISLEKDTLPIKTTALDSSGGATTSISKVEMCVIPEYIKQKTSAPGTTYHKYNFDCHVFQAPQIIPKTTKYPDAENYFV